MINKLSKCENLVQICKYENILKVSLLVLSYFFLCIDVHQTKRINSTRRISCIWICQLHFTACFLYYCSSLLIISLFRETYAYALWHLKNSVFYFKKRKTIRMRIITLLYYDIFTTFRNHQTLTKYIAYLKEKITLYDKYLAI